MTWFKELFLLIKLLFSKTENRPIQPLKMKYFPFSGYSYMSWCGYYVYTKDKYAKISEIARNHETIHLYQASDKDSWIKYYLSYFWEWLIGNPLFNSNDCAYYTNKYEIEAYSKEEDLSYLNRRQKNYVDKFKLENSKKNFKELGKRKFKEYIKEKFSNI